MSLARAGEFLREVVNSSAYGVFAVDDTGVIVFSNGVLENSLSVESDEILYEQLTTLCTDDAPLDRIREAALHGRVTEFTFLNAEGDTTPLAARCDVTEFDGDRYFTLWCQESVAERKGSVEQRRREPTRLDQEPIEELTTIGRELLRAGDRETIAEIGLSAITQILGTDVGCIRLFEEERSDLRRVATTETASELLSSRPVFDLNKSLAGRAFRRGQPVLDTPECAETTDVVERTNLHVPLDGHGTLTVFGSDNPLTSRDIEPVEHLASFVAAGFERLDTDRQESATRRFGTLDTLPVRDLLTRVAGADTQEEIGQRLCDRMVETDVCTGAWFVTTEIDGTYRAVETSAGRTDSLPESVRRTPTDTENDDPVRRAVETDEVCVIQRRQTVSGTNGDGRSPDGESVKTTTVVPIRYTDKTYGVLVLYAPSDLSLGPGVRSELNVMGQVAGLAVYATGSKRLLLSETVQQLEFEVTDQDCLAVAVSDATDAFCEVEHQTLTNDGDHLCFLHVEGATPEEAREATLDIDPVTACRVIDDRAEGCLLEVIKTRSGAEAMMDVGATVRRATADDGVGSLIVETPASTDVRDVVDAYTEMNPESHLVAKRTVDRSDPSSGPRVQDFDDVLTERQRSVLTTAYYSGYFDWPRDSTAEEVADSLGISPATFHQHLRKAEGKLLQLLCEERDR